MALRTKILEYLKRKPSDFLTLNKDLDIVTSELADEINNLVKAGYITRKNDLFYITDRAKEYLKVEESET